MVFSTKQSALCKLSYLLQKIELKVSEQKFRFAKLC